MAQQLHAAGAQPNAEQAPLLVKTGLGTGQGGIYVSISEVPPPGNGYQGADTIARVTPDDEENQSVTKSEQRPGRNHVARIISVLLIGIFVAHADGSILLATHPIIASEFDDMANSSWLITSFALAGAATQTLYGKLSDIYGRKTLVIAAYVIFVVGCAIVGMGQTMWQVILGRVISGAGASGMAGLVSILITDLLPIREVAQWRAYVNLVATLGRSIGGPLGGWLVDVIGWRWSFFGQVPPILLAISLVAISLPSSSSTAHPGADGNGPPRRSSSSNSSSKFSRIDFKGSVIFALAILALLLPIELGGTKLPWSHPAIPGLLGLSGLLLAVFVWVEKRQEEPILPLEIFHRRDAVLSFLILGLQTAAQLGLMFSVPLYFQITARTSNTVSGAHLVPAVVGNALGGLLSGFLIKRSGRYKPLIVLAVSLASISYLLLMLRWHGNTNFWESLYIFPSGLGTGIAQSAVFVALQAAIADTNNNNKNNNSSSSNNNNNNNSNDDDDSNDDNNDDDSNDTNADDDGNDGGGRADGADVRSGGALAAPAVSFLYLSSTVSVTLGLAASDAAARTALRRSLARRLPRLGLGRDEVRRIIANAVADVDFVDRVSGNVRSAIVGAYVDGLWWSHGVSFVFSATAFGLALFMRQRNLDNPRM